ncbi:hypothetical protein FIBSPDRAFT_892545 [Athelia psychrophila]|uniref:Uncharacterized protein n=1 Tax=Athelia psychrophila TaxID=1759441 RepID=A0A166I956_9AGAM|nr:hypothetical protein FIBSPDRAFT_892545 [Fibularhizoctonia sp. CBS 109695]
MCTWVQSTIPEYQCKIRERRVGERGSITTASGIASKLRSVKVLPHEVFTNGEPASGSRGPESESELSCRALGVPRPLYVTSLVESGGGTISTKGLEINSRLVGDYFGQCLLALAVLWPQFGLPMVTEFRFMALARSLLWTSTVPVGFSFRYVTFGNAQTMAATLR